MSSIALGLAFSSPLLFLLKRIPAPPVEPGFILATIQNGGQVLACPPSANIRLYGSSIPHPKGKQRFYIFKYASRNPGIWAAKNPDKIGVFAEHIFFMFLLWRRRRDSNSRTLLRVTRFPVARPRPTRRLLQVVRVRNIYTLFSQTAFI